MLWLFAHSWRHCLIRKKFAASSTTIFKVKKLATAAASLLALVSLRLTARETSILI
jgi:hypothetical protein